MLLGFTAVYIIAIVAVALYASSRERRHAVPGDDPREEHELGGRSLGFMVLLGTLYATQYSGNSFVGFTGKAARDGFAFLGGPLFMQSVIVGYLLFAPALYRLSRTHKYRTPGDFYLHRFEHRGLHILASLVMVFALLNFVLSQLVAIGQLTLVLGQGETIHPAWGIMSLAVVMAAYENLGGMRAVAWTDLLQGGLLFVGVAALFFVIETSFGGFAHALTTFRETWPEKVKPPDARGITQWCGSIVLFMAGAAVYPQAIQRIYSANSSRSLRRSMATMGFMPLFTTLPLVLVGIFAQSRAGETLLTGDNAMPFLLNLLSNTPLGAVVALAVLGGAVAAMMSTADSALLTTSSIVNRDWLERYLMPGRTPEFYLRVAKLCTWVVVLPLGLLATWSVAAGTTIWQILSIKLELLMQIAPALWVGIRTPRLTGNRAFLGMLTGAVITIACWLVGVRAPLGLQAGVWGLAVNLLICLSALWSRPRGPVN
jgi:SSS family solute:Na+ symporter/sodium/pantothenate symporter